MVNFPFDLKCLKRSLQNHIYHSECMNNIEIWYSVVSFFLFFFLPIVLLTLAFTLLFSEIRRLIRNPPGMFSRIGCSRKQRQAVYVLCGMYLGFLLLSMPYFVIRLYIDIQHWRGATPYIPHQVFFILFFHSLIPLYRSTYKL